MADTMDQELAVVTGAGSGLGQALAVELTKRGVKTIGLGRRDSVLQDTQAKAGALFVPMSVDVAEADQVAQAFDVIRKDYGAPTILINNAGVYPKRDTLAEASTDFMHTVAINLGGTVHCTAQALQGMAQAGSGSIINISSFADIAPLPASAAYSVSKGAGRIYSKALYADLADRLPNIVITTWMPGMLATDMGIPDGLPPEQAAKWGASLALWKDPAINGATFEMNREILPPRGLKGKIKDLILFRKPSKARLIPD